MPPRLVAALAILVCCCSRDPISIEFRPAMNAVAGELVPAGWELVEFNGGPRGQAGTYLVSINTLFTEFNIIEFRDAGEEAISVRLNAYALKQLNRYATDPANMKRPIGLRINGRWADFRPLLDLPRDRMFLYGFSRSEKEQLRNNIESR